MGSSESKREEEDVVEIEEDGEFDRPRFCLIEERSFKGAAVG